MVGTPVEFVDNYSATLTPESVSSFYILERWHFALNLLIMNNMLPVNIK